MYGIAMRWLEYEIIIIIIINFIVKALIYSMFSFRLFVIGAIAEFLFLSK
jgi:membrane-anchored glycerophosphoryl diester phosphodiesterase (GDPDase)